jgi:hypothetical protein
MTDYRPTSSTPGPLDQHNGEVIPEDQAKQGRRGLHMLAVLGASLVLVLAAFAGIFGYHAHSTSDTTKADAVQRTAGVAHES